MRGASCNGTTNKAKHMVLVLHVFDYSDKTRRCSIVILRAINVHMDGTHWVGISKGVVIPGSIEKWLELFWDGLDPGPIGVNGRLRKFAKLWSNEEGVKVKFGSVVFCSLGEVGAQML